MQLELSSLLVAIALSGSQALVVPSAHSSGPVQGHGPQSHEGPQNPSYHTAAGEESVHMASRPPQPLTTSGMGRRRALRFFPAAAATAVAFTSACTCPRCTMAASPEDEYNRPKGSDPNSAPALLGWKPPPGAVLDEDGEYVEVKDLPWRETWKARLDKASTMSTDDVLMAARGAGNVDLRDGPESLASQKRRALARCRDAGSRARNGLPEERACVAAVIAGDENMLTQALKD